MSDYVTKDSGARAEYSTGMVRDTQDGKPRFDLLIPDDVPYEALMLTRWAALMERGARKYSRPATHHAPTGWTLRDLMERCSCERPLVIQTSPSTPSDSVEAVMRDTCDSATPSTPSGSERTHDSGLTGIALASETPIGPIARLLAASSSNLSASEQRARSVPSADAHRVVARSRWITTTRQDALEAFSASNATSLSVTSETLGTYLSEHSVTCPIRRFRLDMGQVIEPGDRNWEKAATLEELDRFQASAFRHLMQWMAGEEDEDHAAAVMFNINAYETTLHKRSR